LYEVLMVQQMKEDPWNLSREKHIDDPALDKKYI
jgi:hypothetical protein